MQTDPNRHPGLTDLDHALAAGDVEGARQALLLLNDHERALLTEEIGPMALESAYRGARSRRRGVGLGRVMVLPGLMGTDPRLRGRRRGIGPRSGRPSWDL